MNERRQSFFPKNFGRSLICKLLGVKERVNWKDCILDQSEKKKQVEDLRILFNEKLLTKN